MPELKDESEVESEDSKRAGYRSRVGPAFGLLQGTSCFAERLGIDRFVAKEET